MNEQNESNKNLLSLKETNLQLNYKIDLTINKLDKINEQLTTNPQQSITNN
ncbi:hypothetical protein C1645_779910 [Glomus cerebriforme]|uniref:Uncharacterized protein n=1 Tax=Glomus cerebriforme TaxID=658196 RepID=A0A397STU3_9GLOM|nr:hypothetical protein C1645_779910 [Glomus cerebriforme]